MSLPKYHLTSLGRTDGSTLSQSINSVNGNDNQYGTGVAVFIDRNKHTCIRYRVLGLPISSKNPAPL